MDDGRRTQIIVAVIGAAALLTAAFIANVDKWWPKPSTNTTANTTASVSPSPSAATPAASPTATPTPRDETHRKLVVLMDKNNSSYRSSERHPGGRSNQQDIQEALQGLGLNFHPIYTDVDWPKQDENYKELWEARPDLIIIHASAFSVKRDPQDTSDNFHIFLSKAMPNLPDTKLLIYSTAFEAVPRSRIQTFVSEVNTLRERTTTFKVDAGAGNQYFLDGQVSNNLRDNVRRLLQLP